MVAWWFAFAEITVSKHLHKQSIFVIGVAMLVWFVHGNAGAISLDDIQLWSGSGTNRAALVIEWNSPEVFNQTSVAAPIANKTLVWGYRFNGAASGMQMMQAITAADPKLYVAVDETSGTSIDSIGYNLSGNGVIGITDGTGTNYFTNGILTNLTVAVDAAAPLNSGDLFWSGHLGPKWLTWTESGRSGNFTTSPNRGANPYWDPDTEIHGQWEFTSNSVALLMLTNGSWVGFSVSADGYPDDTNDPAYPTNLAIHINDEQAPPTPDGTYVAYVCNTNDFAVQIVSTSNLDPTSPYNDPTAVLNRPTLNFVDAVDFYPTLVTDRVSLIDPPFNVTPDNRNVITEISSNGQMTVKLGRKVYHNPNNPYGTDLIVYGNSFFIPSGLSELVSDATDLNTAQKSSGIYGHSAIVSVSEDDTNWYPFARTPLLFPDNAYRWDDTNASWTDEEMNPTKPLNPLIYTNTVSQSVANGLDQLIGASGGTGYNLAASGLPWIQFVRVEPDDGVNPYYTVIDAIAAVNPVVVGDALSIAPDNLAAGSTNLAFQSPNDCSQNQIAINFISVDEIARISTVSLSDFSSFAPVEGIVSAAYQIQSRPVTGTNALNFLASLSLRAGEYYSGRGNDLRVFQWNWTNWVSQPFNFNPTNEEISVAGVTNFSAFVISQIIPPQLGIRTLTNGFAFQFTPVPNCPETFQRSTNLVTWTPVYAFTATNAQSIALQDTNAPASQAFYRLQLNP